MGGLYKMNPHTSSEPSGRTEVWLRRDVDFYWSDDEGDGWRALYIGGVDTQHEVIIHVHPHVFSRFSEMMQLGE
jgi:hypothetical protein